MTAELCAVYVQRIACAVAEARAGKTVTFRVDGSDEWAYVSYRSPHRHVVASGAERGMRELLPRVQAEFARQLKTANTM